MSLIGSVSTGVGSVRTAGGGSGAGDGSGIREITSTDGSVVVTNPTGPVTDLSVPAAAGGGWSLELSYGDGNGSTDDDLPVSPESETEFWIGEGMDADHAGPLGGGQVREWPTHQWLGTLRLVAQIDYAQFFGDDWAGSRLVVTVDGVETGIEIAYSDVVVEDDYQTVAGEYVVAPGSKIGLKLVTVALGDGSKLRGHFRIVGGVTADPVGPFVPAYMSLRQEVAPSEEFPIEVVDDEVVNWPNRLGTALDSVKDSSFAAPSLDSEDGIPFIRFDGPQTLAQRTSGVGVFATPPSVAELAPFHIFVVARCNGELGTTRAVISGFALDGGGQALILAPLDGWTFRLAWQYNEEFTANIATASNINTLIVGKWCLYEWICDGPTLTFLINGNPIATVTNDPIGVDDAREVDDNYLGSTFGAGVSIDLRARFVYKEALTAGEIAQTRQYLLDTYPVTP